jgi:Kef-type K+ transport system membrane component KefB
LILPHGKFADMVASMTDDFGGAFLAPLFFSGSGMRLMMSNIFKHKNWPLTLMVIILLSLPKILSTLFATFFFGMRTRDSFALGLILNTKGAIALIMLNTAWDKSVWIRNILFSLFFNYPRIKINLNYDLFKYVIADSFWSNLQCFNLWSPFNDYSGASHHKYHIQAQKAI